MTKSFFDLLSSPSKKEVFLREAPPVPDTGWVRPSYFPDLTNAQVIAYDTETKETDFEHGPGWARGTGHIIGVSVAAISSDGHYGKWYFPVRHEVERGDNLDPVHVFGWLKHTLENTPRTPKVGANLLYDNGWLATEGIIPAGPLYDVQFAEALIDETARTALDVLAHKYVGRGKTTDLCKQWIQATFPQANDTNWRGYLWRCPPRLVGFYAEDDADLPIAILPRQWEIMQQEDTLALFHRECQSIPMLIKMRQQGIAIDLNAAEQLRNLVDKESKDLYGEISRKSGQQIDNVGSPGQLQKLFDAVGIPYPQTKKGAPSFRKEWLGALDDRYGYGKLIGEIREREKLRDTFLDAYLLNRAAVDGRGDGRGIIYCSFHPLRGDDGGAKTGRYSCVAGETPVLTRNGYKAMQDVAVGDEVWTHKRRWRRVIETQIKGVEPMVRVTFSHGGQLTCTLAHRLLSQDGWIKVGQLCRERIEELDSRALQRVARDDLVFQDGDDNCRDSGGLLHDNTERLACYSEQHIGGRTQDAEGAALRQQQDRCAQSDVGQDARSASQLDRRRAGRSRLLDARVPGWEAPLRASDRDGRSFGPARVAGVDRRSSPGLQQNEQCTRQFGVNDASCPQAVTCVDIECVGPRTVYDITVEQDHSYEAVGVFSHNSSDPNLQNIPARTKLGKKVRQAFVPHYGHHNWRKKDHSQIEYRLFAHFAVGAGSDEMRARYVNDPSTDYHNATSLLVAEMRPDKRHLLSLTDDQRKESEEWQLFRKPMKNVNFGLLYGQSENSLAYKAQWTQQEAKTFFASYHGRLPFVKTTMESIANDVQYFGYTTTINNRRTRFNMWESLDYSQRGIALPYDAAIRQWGTRIRRAYAYKAVNYKFQGSAADILKEGMLQCFEQGVYDYTGYPVLQVHDELDWSQISNDNVMQDAFRYAAHVMETCMGDRVRVPLKVDTSVAKNWGEAA